MCICFLIVRIRIQWGVVAREGALLSCMSSVDCLLVFREQQHLSGKVVFLRLKPHVRARFSDTSASPFGDGAERQPGGDDPSCADG